MATSVPCPAILEQRNLSSRWRLYPKVKRGLLMPLRVLLSPQFQEERRQHGTNGLGAMHLGMAAGTKGDHQVEERSSRLAMMNDDGSLIPARSSADTAAVTVTLQNGFSQSTEVGFILPTQGVAGRAHAVREHPLPPTSAVHRSLRFPFHRPRPFPLRNSISLPRTTPFLTASTKPSSTSRASGPAKPPDFALL